MAKQTLIRGIIKAATGNVTSTTVSSLLLSAATINVYNKLFDNGEKVACMGSNDKVDDIALTIHCLDL